MGSSQSYVSNPDSFATRVVEGTSGPKWKEYDYVIVGGGTAGCVLAARLSEDRDKTVLLVEAGPGEGSFLHLIPVAWTKLFGTPIDWAYGTIAQEHAGNRTFTINRGKVLGGTSAINALIYQHCAPEDLDEWVKLGAEGWTYETLKPYFHKSEKYVENPTYPGVLNDNHGTTGPWGISYTTAAPINDVLVNAFEATGVKPATDFNTTNGPSGVGTFMCNVDKDGRRQTIARAYLTKEVLSRPNLTVAVSTTVEKVIFDDTENAQSPRAVGVELSKSMGGPKYRVRASREVIISGGAIATPQILMLSGLGPRAHLEEHGIKVIKDLPQVGRNFYDHMSSGPVVYRTKPGYTLDYMARPLAGLIAMAQWYFFGTGPMRQLAAPGAAFFNVNDSSLDFSGNASANPVVRNNAAAEHTPDVEVLWFPLIVLGFNVPPPPGMHGVSIASVLLKPESAGTVTLRSANPYEKPVLDPNYFDSDNDLNVLVRSIRLILRAARSAPMRKALYEPYPTQKDDGGIFWPGCSDPDVITDDEIKDFIRKSGAAAFHPTSTARMGKATEDSVVDPQLRVHDVKGLRVVDASVFPRVTSGHPVATVVAVAERAADFIKLDARG